jgi:ankyrin repeat protein
VDEVDEVFRAVARGDRAAVARLTKARPELTRARNAGTLSVLQFARYLPQREILDDLIAAGPPLDIFEAAIIDRAERVREILVSDPAQAAAYSGDGFTAMHFAAYFGSTGALQALLAGGAAIEAVTTNFLTNMPIHAAAAAGLEACEVLLKAGANVNAAQHGGFRPLHTPAFTNNRAMAELFLAHGADAGIVNDEGQTPADVASNMGNMELAALLRTHAATG